MKHRSNLARDSLLSTVAGLFVSITSFVSVVLIARVLGVEGAGMVAFAVWAAITGSILANPGAPTVLTRYLPELRAVDQTSSDAFGSHVLRWAATVLVPALTVLVILAVWAPGTMSPVTWLLVAILMVLQTVSTNFNAYLRGLQRFDRLAKVAFQSSVLQISAIAAGVFALGPDGGLIGYAAGAMLPALYGLRLMFHPVPAGAGFTDPVFRRRILSFAMLNWGLAIISVVVWYRAELFFLQLNFGPESVGLFSTGLTLANIATMFPALLLGALLPHFSGQIGRNEIAELKVTYTRFTKLVAFLVFPICFGIAALCPVLIPLLYGQAFAPAIPSAMIVIAGAALGVAVATNANLLLGFEKTQVLFSTNLIGMFLMLIAGTTIIPAYGIEGAAISRVVIQFSIIAMEFWYVIYRLRFAVPAAALMKCFAAAAVCALSAYAIVSSLGAGVWTLLVAIPAGALVYAVMIRVLKVLQTDDREALQTIVQRLPGPVQGVSTRCIDMIVPPKAG